MAFLRTENLESKIIVGHSLRMSLANNLTGKLWSSFMPKRKMVEGRKDENFFSIQIYDALLDISKFDPTNEFTKFAGVEVEMESSQHGEFETLELISGLYAVFLHKGSAQEFPKTMGYIFGSWLPSSDYQLDHRPHFELLGSNYKKNDPTSEEEVWIPIKKK